MSLSSTCTRAVICLSRFAVSLRQAGVPSPFSATNIFRINWPDAKWMYDRAKELNVPFMAGSSLPTCWRNPFLEYDLDTPLGAAIGIGHGGIESYGFHALETLQCMIERRIGGESGVVAVQCLEGEAVWQAGEARTLVS